MDILGFKVTATHTGEVPHFPNYDDKRPHNRFLVKVKNIASHRQISFQFFGSHEDYKKQKTHLDEQDLVGTFYSFLSDADAGASSFDDLLSNFGYESNKQSKAIYRAVVGARKKAHTLGLTDDDVVDLINKLQDDYGV